MVFVNNSTHRQGRREGLYLRQCKLNLNLPPATIKRELAALFVGGSYCHREISGRFSKSRFISLTYMLRYAAICFAFSSKHESGKV